MFTSVIKDFIFFFWEMSRSSKYVQKVCLFPALTMTMFNPLISIHWWSSGEMKQTNHPQRPDPKSQPLPDSVNCGKWNRCSCRATSALWRQVCSSSGSSSSSFMGNQDLIGGKAESDAPGSTERTLNVTVDESHLGDKPQTNIHTNIHTFGQFKVKFLGQRGKTDEHLCATYKQDIEPVNWWHSCCKALTLTTPPLCDQLNRESQNNSKKIQQTETKVCPDLLCWSEWMEPAAECPWHSTQSLTDADYYGKWVHGGDSAATPESPTETEEKKTTKKKHVLFYSLVQNGTTLLILKSVPLNRV